MTINKTIIATLEHTYRNTFPHELKRYLLEKYAQEPFPYEFSEQDLYTNIYHDIYDYEAGELDVTIESPSVRWCKEREYLQDLYIEKSREVHDLEKYITELEHILSEHNLKCPKIAGEIPKF